MIQRIRRLDLVGNILIMGAVVMLLLALQEGGNEVPWNSARIIGLLVGFGAVSILFGLWIVYKRDMALLPIGILGQRTVALSIASSFFSSATILLYAYWLPYWFQTIKGATPLESGVNMLPWAIGLFLFGIIAGAIVNRTGYYNPPLLLGSAIGVVSTGLLTLLDLNTPSGHWIAFEIVGAIGFGSTVQQYFLAIQAVLPQEQIALGTALILFDQNLAGAIFVSIGNALVRNRLIAGLATGQFSGVDVNNILNAGVTDIASYVDPARLPAFLALYNDALHAVFIMATPLAGLALLFALPMSWRSLKAESGDKKADIQNRRDEKEPQP